MRAPHGRSSPALAWLLATQLMLGSLAHAAGPLDLNTVTAEQLAALPGIGPQKAAAVLAWRERNGPFQELGELTSVPGFGPATLAVCDQHLHVSPGLTAIIPDQAKPDGLLTQSAVDPNRADAAQLAALPGISRLLASEIIAERERNGPYSHCRELTRVRGLGPATLAALGPLCLVAGAP